MQLSLWFINVLTFQYSRNNRCTAFSWLQKAILESITAFQLLCFNGKVVQWKFLCHPVWSNLYIAIAFMMTFTLLLLLLWDYRKRVEIQLSGSMLEMLFRFVCDCNQVYERMGREEGIVSMRCEPIWIELEKVGILRSTRSSLQTLFKYWLLILVESAVIPSYSYQLPTAAKCTM